MPPTNRAGRPKKELIGHNVGGISDAEKTNALKALFFEAVQISELPDLDDWADVNIRLPSEAASESGPWSTARFPFLRKIAKYLSPSSDCQEIVFVKGAQVGGTALGTCWQLYAACVNPGPCAYIQKTDDAVRAYSNDKLKTTIRATAEAQRVLVDELPRGYAHAWSKYAYPGGFISLGSGSSNAFLRGKSIRDAIADEEDTYLASVGREGSGVALLAKRQVNFPDAKLFRVSTPVLKETSTIEPAYHNYTQEEYYVPCPHCNPLAADDGYMFVLHWDALKWTTDEKGALSNVYFECPSCAGEIYEHEYKTWMLENGDWYSIKDSTERIKIPINTARVSLKLPSYYSPEGFFAWADCVQEFLDYKKSKDINLLQVHINQTRAETFTLEGREVAHTNLKKRCEVYRDSRGEYDVPEAALVLTAGVDIQDDRIEVLVRGWGRAEESYNIDYAVLPGNTATLGGAGMLLANGAPSVWRLLDDYLLKRFAHQSGVAMPIEVTMLDSGYRTEEAKTFCRTREKRRVYPVKGVAGWGKGLFSVGRRRDERYGTVNYTAYVDECKNKIYSALQIDEPGPGFVHFPHKPCFDTRFFKGLTCETREVKIVNGKNVLYWRTPPGARNEPLDLTVYSYVAYKAYPVNLEKRALGGLASLFPNYAAYTGVAKKPRKRRGSPGL